MNAFDAINAWRAFLDAVLVPEVSMDNCCTTRGLILMPTLTALDDKAFVVIIDVVWVRMLHVFPDVRSAMNDELSRL